MSRRKKAPRGNPAAKVTLYHYTHKAHLPSILESGVLRLTESNVSFEKAHAGPDVVWLTTNSGLLGAESDGLRIGNGESKAQARFTVSVPRKDVHVWETWARQHGSSPLAMEMLARAGGSDGWRVIERPILRNEWDELHVLGDDDGN